MKFFIDTEFAFSPKIGINPLSLCLVSERAESLHLAIDPEKLPSDDQTSAFVRDVVYPVLYQHDPIIGPVTWWTEKIERFVTSSCETFGADELPEFWGDCAAFDYVILSTALGGFERWPEGWPYYINDFSQAGFAIKDSITPHNAYADAVALLYSYPDVAGRVG